MNNFLTLPNRSTKPRDTGLTILIDNGVPQNYFADVVTSFAEHIDYIKFGWCTAYVTANIQAKIDVAKSHDIPTFLGGTFFEKCLSQNKLEDFKRYVDGLGLSMIEISNGTVDISNAQKAKYIAEFSRNYQVFSEVGFKDSERSQELAPSKWIEYINQDLQAGAKKVIMESRESGTSGICRSNGEVRFGLIKDIQDAGICMDDLIFEAPNGTLQKFFTNRFGVDVNLANIPFSGAIGLETLRLGIRADTFFNYD